MSRIALTGIAFAVACLPAAASERTTIVYDTHQTARQLAATSGPAYCDGDVLRVNRPSRQADGSTCSRYITRLHARDLATSSAQEMAAMLKGAIERRPPDGRPAHLVAVDEIGNLFRDPPPHTLRKRVVLGGRVHRIAAHHDVGRAQDGGWVIRRNPAPASEPPGPDHPGSRLTEAMRMLAATPAPWGGSYASRVHLFAAPALTTSIAAGHGTHFTENRRGTLEVRPGWRAVMPALAHAGGVWLAMYHGDGTALDARTWRLGPSRVGRYVERFGGTSDRVHLVFGGQTAPIGFDGCAGPMSCQWTLARAPQNAHILENGVGVWRLGGQTSAFARHHAARFG